MPRRPAEAAPKPAPQARVNFSIYLNLSFIFFECGFRRRGMRLYGMSCRYDTLSDAVVQHEYLRVQRRSDLVIPLQPFRVRMRFSFSLPSLLVFSANAPTATLLGRAAKRGASRNHGSPQRRSSALSPGFLTDRTCPHVPSNMECLCASTAPCSVADAFGKGPPPSFSCLFPPMTQLAILFGL